MSEWRLKLVRDVANERIAAISAEMLAKQRIESHNGASDKASRLLPHYSPKRFDDSSNAERFLELVGDDLLYLAEAKRWMIWVGTHWKFDNENLVFQLAKEFAKSLYSLEDATTDEGRRNARRTNNLQGLNALVKIASNIKTTTIDNLDTQPYLLNCKNGTLDLKTGELRPHSREDRITRLVESNYDPDATSPAFDDFLSTIQPDPDVRAFLQRSIGYSLLGTVRERTFWILYGTGANGKSIFVNLFNNLLGQYASGTTTATIMADRRTSIPNDIARLRGKRLIVIPETEENERLNSTLVKALSAGDQMTARFLFGEYFDFYFTGKLWIATNHKPTITDHSKGLWDRLKLIPFTQNIPPEKVIKSDDLMAQLLADSPAILAWAVQGCRDYLELNGLDVPEVIQTEIDSYRREQDSIAQFIEECCETIDHARSCCPDDYLIPADYRVSNPDLYRAYKRFCEENGEYPRSHRRLTQNMQERGFTQMKSGTRYWDGIRLLNGL